MKNAKYFSTKPFKIHAFHVHKTDGAPAIANILASIAKTEMRQRLKKIGYQRIRLENITPPSSTQKFWLLDFCKLRDDGPGRASADSASEDIEIDATESFTENTAALYDPSTNIMVLQYNHNGPKHGVISEYLSMWLGMQHEEYDLQIKLNKSAQARLKAKKQFTRIKIKAAPAKISADWKKKNVGLKTSIETQANFFGGDIITIDVSVEDARTEDSLSIRSIINGIVSLAAEDRDAVKQVEVSGRQNDNDKIDVINLISEKLEQVYNKLPLNDGRRIELKIRHEKLEATFNTWRTGGQI